MSRLLSGAKKPSRSPSDANTPLTAVPSFGSSQWGDKRSKGYPPLDTVCLPLACIFRWPSSVLSGPDLGTQHSYAAGTSSGAEPGSSFFGAPGGSGDINPLPPMDSPDFPTTMGMATLARELGAEASVASRDSSVGLAHP